MNWKVLDSKYVLQKPWMTVRQDKVKLPSGAVIPEYYVFEYPAWVNVIAITAEGQFVLVRQYRHGIGRETWEIPAGVVETTDRTPHDVARRRVCSIAYGAAALEIFCNTKWFWALVSPVQRQRRGKWVEQVWKTAGKM